MTEEKKQLQNTDFLKHLFLFSSVDDESLNKLLKSDKLHVYNFEKNEEIYTPYSFKKSVGFIISGECCVESIKKDGNTIPLNTLFQFDSFGILTLFQQSDCFPTLIRAKKRSSILFIDGEYLIEIAKNDSRVSLAIIEFMSLKIEFLNQKINIFSASSAEEKLAIFILNEAKIKKSDAIILNMSKTAQALGLGRASIYRALDQLKNNNLISYDNNKIYISDFKGLERMLK